MFLQEWRLLGEHKHYPESLRCGYHNCPLIVVADAPTLFFFPIPRAVDFGRIRGRNWMLGEPHRDCTQKIASRSV